MHDNKYKTLCYASICVHKTIRFMNLTRHGIISTTMHTWVELSLYDIDDVLSRRHVRRPTTNRSVTIALVVPAEHRGVARLDLMVGQNTSFK